VWGAVLALCVLLPTPLVAGGKQHKKVDRLLAQDSSAGPKRVIVRTRPGATASVKARLKNHGDSVYADHVGIDALSATIHADDIAALAADPDVESISTDARVSASQLLSGVIDGTLNSPMNELRTTLGLTGVYAGSDITVAVIDSGLAPSVDFEGRIVGFYDFSNGKPGVSGPAFDDYGHGTHVAGLIGSSGKSSDKRYVGVAPKVKLLPLKVLDGLGAGNTSDVIRALEFAITNKDRFGIRIVNLSLGHRIYESAATDPLVQAVEHAVRSGLIVVTAAGNYGINPATQQVGYAGIASPGNAPSAITVGAAKTMGTPTRVDDRMTAYSSRGPSWYDGIAKPDVVAPGDALTSTLVEGSTLSTVSSLLVQSGTQKYLRLNGSSMAAGVVSGLVAVMLDAHQSRSTLLPAPKLTANAVKAILQFTATPLRDGTGARYDVLTQGAGLVNGAGAVLLSRSTDTAKSAGSFWLTTTLQPWTRFEGVDERWSEQIVWGTRLIQGSSVVEISQFAWADNIVWGTGELDNIVWGTFNNDNIVWGTAFGGLDVAWFGNAALGDNIVWGTADWADNIVWGTALIGFFDGDNIVWGTLSEDNIVWGTLSDDNIVWGTLSDDNIVWGTNQTVTNLGSSLVGGGL
jgi:serine protease AprX